MSQILCCGNNLGESILGCVLRCPACGATITVKWDCAEWEWHSHTLTFPHEVTVPVVVSTGVSGTQQ